jgi:hypothetical protein
MYEKAKSNYSQPPALGYVKFQAADVKRFPLKAESIIFGARGYHLSNKNRLRIKLSKR